MVFNCVLIYMCFYLFVLLISLCLLNTRFAFNCVLLLLGGVTVWMRLHVSFLFGCLCLFDSYLVLCVCCFAANLVT